MCSSVCPALLTLHFRRIVLYTHSFQSRDDPGQFQQILWPGQCLAVREFNKGLSSSLVCPLRQKISGLAIIQTVEQPSVAKPLSVILILKLSPKPRMKWMGDAKPSFSLSTVQCSLLSRPQTTVVS